MQLLGTVCEQCEHLRQDSVNGVAALCEHQVFVKHEVEGEGLAEGVRADAGLLRAVLLEAVQVLVEGLLLRVLLLDQELDVVAVFIFRLDHLRTTPSVKHDTVIDKDLWVSGVCHYGFNAEQKPHESAGPWA